MSDEPLYPPFKIVVQDSEGDLARLVCASGINSSRIAGRHGMSIFAWFDVQRACGSLPAGELYMSYDFGPQFAPQRQHFAEQFPLVIADTFWLFCCGAACGWNIVDGPSDRMRDCASQIEIHSHLKRLLSDEVAKFRPPVALRRSCCRADVLRRFIALYDERGPGVDLPSSELAIGLLQTALYPREEVASVESQLLQEGFLEGTFGHSWIPAGMRDPASAEADRILTSLLKHIEEARIQLQVSLRDVSGRLRQRKSAEGSEVMSKLTVFLIHGTETGPLHQLARHLEKEFDVSVRIMKEAPGSSRTLIEKFEQEASECNAAIAILTPDDMVTTKDAEIMQARPNVMFELGWFCGKFARNRTLLIVQQGTEIPSDLHGIEYLSFRADVDELHLRLKKEIERWRATGA